MFYLRPSSLVWVVVAWYWAGGGLGMSCHKVEGQDWSRVQNLTIGQLNSILIPPVYWPVICLTNKHRGRQQTAAPPPPRPPGLESTYMYVLRRFSLSHTLTHLHTHLHTHIDMIHIYTHTTHPYSYTNTSHTWYTHKMYTATYHPHIPPPPAYTGARSHHHHHSPRSLWRRDP